MFGAPSSHIFDVSVCDLGPGAQYAQFLRVQDARQAAASQSGSLNLSNDSGLYVSSVSQSPQDSDEYVNQAWDSPKTGTTGETSFDDPEEDDDVVVSDTDVVIRPTWAEKYTGELLAHRQSNRQSPENHIIVAMSNGSFLYSSEMLGRGTYGIVTKAHYFSTGSYINNGQLCVVPSGFEITGTFSDYIIKTMIKNRKNDSVDELTKCAEKEAEMLQMVYKDWCGDISVFSYEETVRLIMPYQPGHDIEYYLKSSEPVFSWTIFLAIFDKMIEIMQHLQSVNVVHLDVKPANFMLKISGDRIVQLKLLDFGLAEYSNMPIPKYIEKKSEPVPHVSSDRLFSSEIRKDRDFRVSSKKKYTIATKWQDYFSVGYVLEQLTRIVEAPNEGNPEAAKQVLATVRNVRPYYDNPQNDRKTQFLLNTRATLFALSLGNPTPSVSPSPK